MASDTFEKVVSLAKRRGFVYPSSDIYGGFAGFWDYGPLGVEFKNNIKRQWWADMVYAREDVVGLDAAIIMNPQVWEASGHTKAFTDPLVECKICHKRFKADQDVEIKEHDKTHPGKASWTEPKYVREARQREADKATFREMLGYIGTTEQELRDLGVADDIFPD